MNKKITYTTHPFKVKFRTHNCYKCGTSLEIIKHRRIVDQKAIEARFFDFSFGTDCEYSIGPCEFIHKVFYCKSCSANIEFKTQLNQEDIDIIIEKVKKHFEKKGRTISIDRCYEDGDGQFVTKVHNPVEISNLCLMINEGEREDLIYKVRISFSDQFERPFYFDLSKRKLIKFINNS